VKNHRALVTPPGRRRVVPLLMLTLFVFWAALIAVTAQTAWFAYDGLQRVNHLRATGEDAVHAGSLDPALLPQVQGELMAIRDDVDVVQRRLGYLQPTPFSWLGGHRYQLAFHGTRAAAAVARAGLTVTDAALALTNHGTMPLQLNVVTPNTIAMVTPALQDARNHLDQALKEIDEAQVRPGDGRPGELLSKTAGQLRDARGVLILGSALPGLLGNAGETHLLILLQNPDELRASGGFLGTASLITFRDSRIVAVDSTNSNTLINPSVPGIAPPAPYATYMDMPSWSLRDADWWPDFPSSAQAMIEFLRLDRDIQLQAVVVIDPATAGAVLDAVGGVDVPGYNEHVTSGNVLPLVNSYTHTGDLSPDYKRFVTTLATATVARLQTASVGQLRTVVTHLGATLDSRHMSIYLPAYQSLLDLRQELAARHWDGALIQADGDHRLLVDANVGYNKVSGVVEERMTDDVTVAIDGSLSIRTTVTYHYPPVPDNERWRVNAILYGNGTWQSVVKDHFRNYVRLYTPAGTELEHVSGLDASNPAYPESGKSVFSGFIDMPPRTDRTVSWRYRVPPIVAASTYDLYVQRQNRGADLTYHLTLRDAAGMLADRETRLTRDMVYRVPVAGITRGGTRVAPQEASEPASQSYLAQLKTLQFQPPPVTRLTIPALTMALPLVPVRTDLVTWNLGEADAGVVEGTSNPHTPGTLVIVGDAATGQRAFDSLPQIGIGTEVHVFSVMGDYAYRVSNVEQGVTPPLAGVPAPQRHLYLVTQSTRAGETQKLSVVTCDYVGLTPA